MPQSLVCESGFSPGGAFHPGSEREVPQRLKPASRGIVLARLKACPFKDQVRTFSISTARAERYFTVRAGCVLETKSAVMPTRSQLGNLLVLIACSIAAYLSFVSFGGYLVFGFHNLSEFCFIGAPLFALPVALLGFRYRLTSTALSLVIMALHFGVQIYHFGPPWSAVLHNGTQFYKFLAVAVLLAGAAGLERCRSDLGKA